MKRRATRADLLFAAAETVRRVVVGPGAEAWAEPLRAAGVEVATEGPCELLVMARYDGAAAAAAGAATVLVERPVSLRRLRRDGFVGQRYLPMPALDHPALLLPLDRPRGARYALLSLSAPPGRAKRLRNRVMAEATRFSVTPPGTLTIATREPRPPRLVGAALELGLPDDLDWVLTLGRATERGAFHLLTDGRSRPTWVLKFSRAPLAQVEPPTDAAGLGLVGALGGEAAARAPRLLGVSEADGRPFVVESAAAGADLVTVLRTAIPAKRKHALVDGVASWLIELGRASLRSRAGDATLPDAQHIERSAAEFGVDRAVLADRIASAPAVLEHGDAGLEHVLVDAASDDFVVIDWERARADGLPFHDLCFFLAQALPTVDGEIDDPRYDRHEAFARLFRGDSPSSPLLFGWIRRAVAAWGIPEEAVAALVSTLWLRFAVVDVRRHFAEAWFADPALGLDWSEWRG